VTRFTACRTSQPTASACLDPARAMHTLLIHLSSEDGDGWTTVAVDRRTRRWAIAQERRQRDAASEAYEQLYGD
jgi:hypothetical protein